MIGRIRLCNLTSFTAFCFETTYHGSSPRFAYVSPIFRCWTALGENFYHIKASHAEFCSSRLRESWYEALDTAQANFRQLLTSHEWKRVSLDGSQSNAKGKARVTADPHLTDVSVHRKVVKGESVYRAVLDVPLADEPQLTLEACKAILTTPELRKEWDPAVEKAQLLEMFDQATRIAKTNFTLGWPAR